MRFDSLHHIAIICSDYKKSKNFYVNLLGLEVVNETYRPDKDSFKLDLKVSDTTQIELFSFPKPARRASFPEATGLRHIAFEVDDVAKTADELNSQGIHTEPIRLDKTLIPEGKRYTFFKDPDGLPIEIYER